MLSIFLNNMIHSFASCVKTESADFIRFRIFYVVFAVFSMPDSVLFWMESVVFA